MYSLTSPYGHLSITDSLFIPFFALVPVFSTNSRGTACNSLLRRLTVRLVTEMPKSYIPYLYNTDTSVKRTLGSVPLVSVLKRFGCKLYFFILWPFHLFPWASYLMTYYPGISNICRSIINYTTINVDIKWKYPKRGALHVFLVYSYFEQGCRKKCTRQSGKVLWVVLSPLFFKEIWQNGTRGHEHMLASAKGKQQKYVRRLQWSGTVHWSYPIIPFGIVACTFFRQPFSK